MGDVNENVLCTPYSVRTYVTMYEEPPLSPRLPSVPWHLALPPPNQQLAGLR